MLGMKETVVRLPSGRILEISEGGDLEGVPVFSLHGTPGSRLLYPAHTLDAQKRGIRLIGYSRPGYGNSTRQPGRKPVDGASDVAAIADSLGLEKFAVWGHSGGSMYALACAASLPDRVVAASALSGLAPYGAKGFDFFAGMGEYNIEDFKLMVSDQAAWEKKQVRDAEVMARATREDMIKLIGSLISNIDREVLTEELADFLQAQSREGFKAGVAGIIDDNLADAKPWGFDLTSVKVPLQIWHGRHDMFVPFSHGRWLASQVPRAEAHLEENGGHLTMFVRRIPEVHRWLASKF